MRRRRRRASFHSNNSPPFQPKADPPLAETEGMKRRVINVTLAPPLPSRERRGGKPQALLAEFIKWAESRRFFFDKTHFNAKEFT